MTCLTPEDLICLAMDPAREENRAAFSHLAVCRKCRENYQLALESLLEDEFIPSAEEEKAAADAAAELTGPSAAWKKFHLMIEEFAKKIPSPKNIFAQRSFEPLKAPALMRFAACTSRNMPSRASSLADEIKFTFESYAAPESGIYWKMQMTMPHIPSASARILMKVTGADGRALDGTLNFLNGKTPMPCGIASVPFQLFLENKGCREISFVSGNGKVSPGRIKFLPEALQ